MRGRRTILPGETGVRYDSTDGTVVLWAFAALDLSLKERVRICDVLAGTETVGRQVEAKRHRVYAISGRGIVQHREAVRQWK